MPLFRSVPFAEQEQMKLRWSLRSQLILLALVATVIGACSYYVHMNHQWILKGVCEEKLGRLAFALLRYREDHGEFPPAYVSGPDGKPWHSWRVLIMPYLGSENAAAFKQYRFDEPWNGKNNSRLASQFESGVFRCPGTSNHSATNQTDYMVVVGSKTLFPGAIGFRGDMGNALLLVEVEGSEIHWMEPHDISYAALATGNEEMSFGVGSVHRAGVNAVVCKGDRISCVTFSHRSNRKAIAEHAVVKPIR